MRIRTRNARVQARGAESEPLRPLHAPQSFQHCRTAMASGCLDDSEHFKASFVPQQQLAAYSQPSAETPLTTKLPPSRSDIPQVSAEASHGAHPRSRWLEATSRSRSCVQVMATLPEANQVPATSKSSIFLPGVLRAPCWTCCSTLTYLWERGIERIYKRKSKWRGQWPKQKPLCGNKKGSKKERKKEVCQANTNCRDLWLPAFSLYKYSSRRSLAALKAKSISVLWGGCPTAEAGRTGAEQRSLKPPALVQGGQVLGSFQPCHRQPLTPAPPATSHLLGTQRCGRPTHHANPLGGVPVSQHSSCFSLLWSFRMRKNPPQGQHNTCNSETILWVRSRAESKGNVLAQKARCAVRERTWLQGEAPMCSHGKDSGGANVFSFNCEEEGEEIIWL